MWWGITQAGKVEYLLLVGERLVRKMLKIFLAGAVPSRQNAQIFAKVYKFFSKMG